MENIVEDFQKKCKNCGHIKGDHYSLILDYPFKNKEKGRAGVCRVKDCNCKKFEPKENMDTQTKNSKENSKNSSQFWTVGEEEVALAELRDSLSSYGITVKAATELPEHTKKLSVRFFQYPKKEKQLKNMSDQEIKNKVQIAINRLFKNDPFLLINNAHERSVAHKLAEYLQQQFSVSDWQVDCEYNLHGADIKLLDDIKECPECFEEKKTDRIFPDIIIHQRNTDEDNLLVVEVKMGNKSNACDLKKLELLTGEVHPYKYSLGLFIKFKEINEPNILWFKNGKQEDRSDIKSI